ncbi:hypothetical protein D6D15_04287 [Aureobasidium pullulans]|uniref:Rhodopsin domain-containing protein n=1 Tax=Aureobasidium pullulans TaxID=5580 RepID=A0A4S9BE96_AURPU|nr:hypothetical protein D6D15_04287 [Aureobasidium pullulans]
MRARWTPISRKYPNHSAAATIARACSRRRAKGSDVESDNHANDCASTLRHNIQSYCPLVSGSHTTTQMSLGPRVPTQVTGFARCGTEVPSFAILRWRSQDQDRLILVKDSTPTRGQSYMQSNSGHDLKHCQSYGGRGPLLVRIAIVEAVVATIFLLLRVYTLLFIAPRRAWDLFWNATAWFSALISIIFISIACHNGIANHLDKIDPEDLPTGNLFSWLADTFFILSSGTGKLAVIALLFHVQGPTKRNGRRFLWFIGGSDIFWSIFQMIFLWFQCKPIHKLWHQEIAGSCMLTAAIVKVGIFVGAYCAACDFVLAFYPIFLFWKLETSWKTRAGLSLLFCGGAVAGAAAILKTYYLMNLAVAEDITYAWAITEQYLIIIMSSIPTIRPLCVKVFRRAQSQLSTAKANTHPTSQSRWTELQSFRNTMQPSNTQSMAAAQYHGHNDSSEEILATHAGHSKSNSGIMVTTQVSIYPDKDEEQQHEEKESFTDLDISIERPVRAE